jgi:hypothetical protein
MRIADRDYTRDEVLRRVGGIHQLGGTRHYVLAEGRSKGISAIDFDTGCGLRFAVLPDRGLDISKATFKGVNLVFFTQNGEVHPAFYESGGNGWLRTFFAGVGVGIPVNIYQHFVNYFVTRNNVTKMDGVRGSL